ncbi:metal ABC transporter permease [Marininema halotolerans]|uniref:Zinc transport system permease protein n=1 Tax=Marininema halotolerans TaxID=1155944 RepID=A0A1I6PD33_9BACL|nr:metal ABC transporter permease [Marininema halotolerans]SFS38079.1 zinc transport system permease protein [Marininema halotolerans]
MVEILLHYGFMQRALIAGVIIGLISPIVGVFLVVRRLSLIADALAHVTLSGVAAGLLLQKYVAAFAMVSPLYMGMAFSMVASVFVEQLRRLYRSYQELAIPVILSGGIGLGVVLISAANGFNVDVAGYLFGSILAVGKSEILAIVGAGLFVLVIVFLFYKELFALSFDEESAVYAGIPRHGINLLFSLAVALVITASIRVVGILLVSGLITLPVAASLQLANSFKQAIVYAVIFAQISVLAGLVAAFYLDWASGGTIVLVAVGILLCVMGMKRLIIWMRKRQDNLTTG